MDRGVKRARGLAVDEERVLVDVELDEVELGEVELPEGGVEGVDVPGKGTGSSETTGGWSLLWAIAVKVKTSSGTISSAATRTTPRPRRTGSTGTSSRDQSIVGCHGMDGAAAPGASGPGCLRPYGPGMSGW